MSKESKIKVVRIHWLDHNGTPGWKSLKDISIEGYPVESVGWLIGETDEAILLAMSVGSTKAADFLCIIKSCITDRWEL